MNGANAQSKRFRPKARGFLAFLFVVLLLLSEVYLLLERELAWKFELRALAVQYGTFLALHDFERGQSRLLTVSSVSHLEPTGQFADGGLEVWTWHPLGRGVLGLSAADFSAKAVTRAYNESMLGAIKKMNSTSQ